VYCNRRCHKAALRELERAASRERLANRICAHCGRKVPETVYHNAIYCGKVCLKQAMAARQREKFPGECAHCGKHFMGHVETQKYCSLSCSALQNWKAGPLRLRRRPYLTASRFDEVWH
jgi:hypothetical protein